MEFCGGENRRKTSRLEEVISFERGLLSRALYPICPTHVANRLEAIQKDFLWEGIDNIKRISLVHWDVVCSSVKEGSRHS